MELVKYRDWGMSTHTWFWVDENNRVLSPYFNSEDEAWSWQETIFNQRNKNETEKSNQKSI